MAKLVIFVVILCVGYVFAEKEIVRLPPEIVGQILQGAMLCIGETGVSPEVLVQYRSGKPLGDDKNLQMFIHCLLVKNGFADKTGHVKTDKALDVFPKTTDTEAVKKVIHECNKQTAANPAEMSYKFVKCFRQKAHVKIVI